MPFTYNVPVAPAQYEMELTIDLRDFYDFHMNGKMARLVFDTEMSLLSSIGVAKPFHVYGEYKATVSWEKGGRVVSIRPRKE